MQKPAINFTHYWVSGFGWENTIYQPEQFTKIEILGVNEEGIIYFAENEHGVRHIFKQS